MKNQCQTLLICIFSILFISFITGNSYAQITINSEDYPSEIGTYIITEDDTAEIVEVDVGLPGENQIWYFDREIPGILTRQLVVDKNNTPYLEDFPAANMVVRYAGELGFLVHSYYFDDTEGLFYSYQNINQDSLVILGIGVDSSVAHFDGVYLNFQGPIDLEPDILQFPFPLNYGDTWETVSHGTVEVDTMLSGIWTTIRTEVNDSIYSEVDGWGTIHLPDASHECLRVKSYITLDEQIYTNGVLLRDRHTRTINYTWISKEYGIVARIISHSDEPDDNFTEAKQVSRLYLFNPNVNVSLTDTIAAPGDSVTIPIRVSNLSDLDIFDLKMDVLFETDIIQALNVVTEGTLLEDWDDPVFSMSDSGMRLNATGTIPLVGDGILFYLDVLINTQAGEMTQTEIAIENILVEHDGPVFNVTPGKLMVAYNYDIAGSVKYYSNDNPIEAVSVNLGEYHTTTASDGNFVFTIVPKGDYTLRPMKDGDLKNSISAFDASLILRANVGDVELSPYQKIAADVSGNGGVSAYDASFILRYSVGLITEFPVGDDWCFIPAEFALDDNNWNASPLHIEYSPLEEDKSEQDFKGIVYGDVSGTWSAEDAKNLTLYKSFAGNAVLEVGSITQDADKVLIPLSINSDCEIISGKLEISYSSSGLMLKDVELNARASGVVLEYMENDGIIKIAIASQSPLNEVENLIRVEFKQKTAKPRSASSIQFSSVELNGGLVSARASNELIVLGNTLPDNIQLIQNYPNPFNASTLIRYQLPKRSRVRIAVYNSLGQTINILKDDVQSAGSHEILWNGKNSSGYDVPSGIYFYELKVVNSENNGASKHEMRKMLLIR